MSERAASGLVLVVDDHEMIRDLLTRNLESQGHRVISAPNGRAALELLPCHPFELVLLDIMMPEMNGVEVLQHLKANPDTSGLPVLVLSADSDTERVATCIGLGADDYIVKPFNPVVLRARVTTCLERYRLRKAERAYQLTLEERVAERTALAEQRAAALERSESALRRQTAVLQSILDSMGDGVVVVDGCGELLHSNPAAGRILGERLPALLPDPAGAMIFRYADRVTFCAPSELPLARAVRGSEIDSLELYLAPAPEHAEQWLSITARPLREGNGTLVGGVAVVRDVTDSHRAMAALRESEERYSLAARGANDGLWDWDLFGNRIYFSPRWKSMLGYAEQDVGSTLSEWLDRVHPDDRERLEARLTAHHRRLISHFEHEYRIRHRDESYRWMLCRGLAVWDADGRAVRMAGSQTDITSRKRVEEQLLYDAFHDGLTDLPNRALFVDRLENALGRMRRSPSVHFAVLFLDLDRFKVINDSLGHAAGDQLLTSIARRLPECVRPGDTVARLGGDEFTVLLEDVQDEQVARAVANRIQTAISAPVRVGEQDIYTTASIGILMSNPDYNGATDMIRDADTAMYHAKMTGKARSVFFDPAMHAQAMSRLQLESDLRWAVERDELRVHYQPIIALDSGQLVGVEALVRWQHPQRGLLFPSEFLNIAEESGLIVPISWWTLRTACAQLANWQRTLPGGEQLWTSVNLSARQLAQRDMLAQVKRILHDTGLAATSLKLEITEHTLVEYGDVTIQVLTELRALGVQLCIDDFGTGYSSLSYLQRFPVDVLKIDRSFISQLGERGKRSEIVRTILGLARTLGMQAVAEGTETLQQADELRRLACDYGQGWLFSKAVDATAIRALVAEERPFA